MSKPLDLSPEESIAASQYSDIDSAVSSADGVEDGIEPEKNDTSQKQSWKEILILGFSSLGAIYGDIGTSPLYVLNTIKYPNSPPSQTDIYGAVSVIFYLFTIIVIIKYLLIVLVIGPNNGEGGQVAIYAKIARHLKIGPRGVTIPGGPEKDDLLLLSRQETSLSFVSLSSKLNNFKNSPGMIKIISKIILCGCFLGCSLVISDGLLTPTTSVLSAIAGIQIAKPDFDNVLVVSEVVLVCLFVMQQFGSAKISFAFAPIIFLWLIGLFICGVINIAKYHPGIFKALSPYYAIQLLRNGGIDVFSGAMLAITGTEAMFADIGHFGRLPVQLSLTVIVYPALIICYLGQAAFILHNPEALLNPFFFSIPGGLNSPSYWVMFVLATLSTIIASQALILGVFLIIAQLINLDCFPKFKIVHVSKNYSGKVYIPAVNWALMVGVVCTTAGFKNSNNVTAAYGLGITLDFLVTSVLIMICMVYVYEWNLIIPIIFCLVFVPLEIILVVSNLKKVVHGAWFPIMMAGLVYLFLSFWRWARSKKVDQEFKARVKIGDLYPEYKRIPVSETVDLRNGDLQDEESRGRQRLREEVVVEYGISLKSMLKIGTDLKVNTIFGNQLLKRYPGVAIMYTEAIHTLNSPNTVPQLYKTMVSSFPAIPSVFIFCAVRVLSIPIVLELERVMIGSMKIPGHYRCILRFGFMEEVRIDDDLLHTILNTLPDTPDLIDNFSKGLIRNTSSIPVMHVFENELLRSHRYVGDEYSTKNPLIKIQRWLRKFMINHMFSPINSAFRPKGQILKGDEEKEKVFIGSVVRI